MYRRRMCGRFTNIMSWSKMVELYRLTEPWLFSNAPARYNIAPTQGIAIVRRRPETEERELTMARWGLVPFWAKDLKISYNLINARAETVESKPSFRQAFKRRRCLIAADGFYEWKPLEGRKKQPYRITLAEHRPFAFAGLWETWTSPEGESVESCTIIVTKANDQLKPIHDRMPVILEPDRFDSWLDTERPLPETKSLFHPYDGKLSIYPVSQHVNNARNNDPQCMEAISGTLG